MEKSMEIKSTKCPECGCVKYKFKNELGEGFRVCVDCDQEWWIDIEYDNNLKK